MLKTPIIRPMTRSDLVRLKLDKHDCTVRGMVADLDGELLGSTGVIHSHPPQAYASMDKRMGQYPKLIIKVIRDFKVMLEENYVAVYAIACPSYKNSIRVLERAGFKFYQRTPNGRVYRWLHL